MIRVSRPVSHKFPSVGTSEPPPGTSAIDEYLKQLQQSNPELQIHIASVTDNSAVKDIALSQSGLFHVTIDPAILKQMAEDPSIRAKYEKLLGNIADQHRSLKAQADMSGKKTLSAGTIIDEQGNVITYSATEIIPKELPKDTTYDHYIEMMKPKENKNPHITITYKFNYGSQMMRLAQAKSVQNVRGVISTQHQEISRARSLVPDRTEAAMIMSRIRGVIQKGNLKISRLRKEETLERSQQIAYNRQKAALERELALELRNKRTARRGQEHCDTIDMIGALDNRSEAQLRYESAAREYQIAALELGGSAGTAGVPSMPAPSGGQGIGGGVEISIDIMG